MKIVLTWPSKVIRLAPHRCSLLGPIYLLCRCCFECVSIVRLTGNIHGFITFWIQYTLFTTQKQIVRKVGILGWFCKQNEIFPFSFFFGTWYLASQPRIGLNKVSLKKLWHLFSKDISFESQRFWFEKLQPW